MDTNIVGQLNFTTVTGGSTTAITVGQNSTVFTGAFPFRTCNGYSSALVTNAAGSVTITQQCSPDGQRWFTPVDSTNSSIGVVVTAMSVNTAGRYVQYNPVLCSFIRFQIIEINIAATTVGIILYPQEGT